MREGEHPSQVPGIHEGVEFSRAFHRAWRVFVKSRDIPATTNTKPMKTKTTNTTPNRLLETGLLLESNELVSGLIKTQATDLRRAAARLDEAADALCAADYDASACSYRQHHELLANHRRLASGTLATLDGLALSTSAKA